MYVCMYVCMHVCMHVCMYIYKHAYMHTYVCVCIYINIYILAVHHQKYPQNLESPTRPTNPKSRRLATQTCYTFNKTACLDSLNVVLVAYSAYWWGSGPAPESNQIPTKPTKSHETHKSQEQTSGQRRHATHGIKQLVWIGSIWCKWRIPPSGGAQAQLQNLTDYPKTTHEHYMHGCWSSAPSFAVFGMMQ
jgi:hypothetical protein